MALTPNLEYANNSGFLWPPIADALDTFLRRRHRESAPFERVWRLIHVWEGVAITLAIASMARLRLEIEQASLLLRQREFFYGKSWDPVTASFKKSQGAADGAIDQWLNILDEIAKASSLPGRFLPALSAFLKAEAVDVAPLVTHWAKACDVPSDFQSRGIVEVRVAMRYINSFRNRVAHVPFPHDPLEDIGSALESATEQLFGIPPLPAAHEKDGHSSSLTGAFRIGLCFLHGSSFDSLPQADPSPELQFVFPCQKRGEIESWPASVVVHIDSMMRPHILTRVKGIDVCEYTRFRAEANAVLVLPKTAISVCLPEPDKTSYLPDPSIETEKAPEQKHEITIADALDAIRNDDFDTGIEFFSDLVRSRPEYHVAWLRLGHARREKAARLLPTDTTAAIPMLKSSLEDLMRAAAHVDPSYKALAHYERSKKTAYRLAQVSDPDETFRSLARDEALKACKLSSERKYQTWLEYLDTYSQNLQPPKA